MVADKLGGTSPQQRCSSIVIKCQRKMKQLTSSQQTVDVLISSFQGLRTLFILSLLLQTYSNIAQSKSGSIFDVLRVLFTFTLHVHIDTSLMLCCKVCQVKAVYAILKKCKWIGAGLHLRFRFTVHINICRFTARGQKNKTQDDYPLGSASPKKHESPTSY